MFLEKLYHRELTCAPGIGTKKNKQFFLVETLFVKAKDTENKLNVQHSLKKRR